ncbi:MAG: hypothetical protein AABY42_09285 [Nitrospirota bacterium]
MPKREKPLPRPKKTPFGVVRDHDDDEGETPLTADRMMLAMSEGKLDEFLDSELPGNQYARALADMMMGMTGMLPSFNAAQSVKQEEGRDNAGQPAGFGVSSGGSEEVSSILKKQFEEGRPAPDTSSSGDSSFHPELQGSMHGSIDKQTLEDFINIAKENHLSIDWLMLRAVRLFVQDYKKTGRL